MYDAQLVPVVAELAQHPSGESARVASGQLGRRGDQGRGRTSASGRFAAADQDLERRDQVESLEVLVGERELLCHPRFEVHATPVSSMGRQ